MLEGPKHRRALDRAKWDLERGTKEIPNGSNSGPRVREMQHHTWLGGTGWPWCVAACVTWAEEAGFKLPYQGAGAYQFLDWARRAGWDRPIAQTEPGDFVVFNIGAGHMAMLESKGKGSVVTIGGNESNRVKRTGRSTELIRGCVHLPESHTVKPAKPPLYEVVTSEGGTKVIYASTARGIGKKIAEILKKHPHVVIRRKKK